MCNAAKKTPKSAEEIPANAGPASASVVNNSNMYEVLNVTTRETQQPNYESLPLTGIDNARTDAAYQQLDLASVQSPQPQNNYEALSPAPPHIYVNA